MLGLSLAKILFTIALIFSVWKIYRVIEARNKRRVDEAHKESLDSARTALAASEIDNLRETVEDLQQVAYRILRDRHLAEDATQQALINVWRKLPTLKDPAKFEAWSYRFLVYDYLV
jgi:type VI protein secretion system component VasK